MRHWCPADWGNQVGVIEGGTEGAEVGERGWERVGAELDKNI
jgi:hypothetical protein